jgi:hypothetical protein
MCLFPKPDDSFLGWLFRLFAIIAGVLLFLYVFEIIDDRREEKRKAAQWERLYPDGKPDWTKKNPMFPPRNTPRDKDANDVQDIQIHPDIWVDGKKVTIEELFRDYDLANDYEDLYEKFRD